MDYYRLLRPLLFRLEPEQAHDLVIFALKHGLVPAQPDLKLPMLQTECAGLKFKNPVGLAAGFDKNAVAYRSLAKQGFGFLELGTVTPQPQPGNDKPRLFRLQEDEAVINRFGFNSEGLEFFCHQLAKLEKHPLPLGGNIGKNKTSDDALADYTTALKAVYPLVDYVTVNISSPNTAGLRDLQGKEALSALLAGISEVKAALTKQHGKSKPLLVKIAPDLSPAEVEEVVEVVTSHAIDGLIVSNTTIARAESLQSQHAKESGGLSGAPLKEPALQVLQRIYQRTSGKLPLIGVGGISSGDDAYQRIRAGASLVQLYSALVYEGFGLVTRINRELAALLMRDGVENIADIVGIDAQYQG